MNSEEFNKAYHAMLNREPFAVELTLDCVFTGRATTDDALDFLLPDSVAWHFLNTEIECGTLEYVFRVNYRPIAFAGAFGLLTIPLDCFNHYPPDFPEYRRMALDEILELTSPIVDGNDR